MNDITKPTIDPARLAQLKTFDAELIAQSLNKNDRATTIAQAYLTDRAASDSELAELLTKIGFDRRHVWAILRSRTGHLAGRERWPRDENGWLDPSHPEAASSALPVI